MSQYCVVLSTFNDEKNAQETIETILSCKLAACIQTLNIDSHYTWEGKICREREILVLFKSTWDMYESLENKIKELHSYDIPEIIAIDVEKGFSKYLDWIKRETGQGME